MNREPYKIPKFYKEKELSNEEQKIVEEFDKFKKSGIASDSKEKPIKKQSMSKDLGYGLLGLTALVLKLVVAIAVIRFVFNLIF